MCTKLILVSVMMASVMLSETSRSETSATSLNDQDVVALRERNRAYVASWLAGDAEAIMANFTDDAVLMPALGTPEVKGVEAIRRFYWPEDAPPSTVTKFVMEPVEISGTGGLGYVRGSMELSFTVEEESTTSFTTEGNYLMLMRRVRGGTWQISCYIWNHPPWESELPDR